MTTLQQLGAQVLDLEVLAAHRGSLLGNLPEQPQPSQKMFEGRLWWQLHHFDPQRPVYVEAESKRIGVLRMPESLMRRMWQPGRALRLETTDPVRIAWLKQDYRHFLTDPAALMERLSQLTELYGHQQIETWQALVNQQHWDELVLQLLHRHYDRSYEKSMLLHYPDYASRPLISLSGSTDDDLTTAAHAVLAVAGH